MQIIITLLLLSALFGCGTFRQSRRLADRDYNKDCIKELYNEGIAADASIKACKDLTYQ